MKHSSSMGQKILASILIRLAMAKVFSPKSCILALDDPTAHLDRESINDLAEYLKKILEMNEF